jgi:hypothetical protein
VNPVPIEQPVSDITPEMADTDGALRRALHEAVDAICNVDMEFVTRDLTATLARCGMFSQVAHVAHLAAQRNALFDAFINERDKAHIAKVEAERVGAPVPLQPHRIGPEVAVEEVSVVVVAVVEVAVRPRVHPPCQHQH